MRDLLLKMNSELFKTSGVLTLVLFSLETFKDGFVSFFINPAIFLFVFLFSAIIWLFTQDSDSI